MSKNIVFVPITNFAAIKVQIYLLFIIMSNYQVYLDLIDVLRTMVMVSRLFFGHIGYLWGPEWALNEHNSYF